MIHLADFVVQLPADLVRTAPKESNSFPQDTTFDRKMYRIFHHDQIKNATEQCISSSQHQNVNTVNHAFTIENIIFDIPTQLPKCGPRLSNLSQEFSFWSYVLFPLLPATEPTDVRGVEGTFRDRVREILQSSNDAP